MAPGTNHTRKDMTACHCSGRKLNDQGATDLVNETLWTVYSKEHGGVSCKAFHLKASPAQIHPLCPKDFVFIPVPELSNMLLSLSLSFSSSLFYPCLSLTVTLEPRP